MHAAQTPEMAAPEVCEDLEELDDWQCLALALTVPALVRRVRQQPSSLRAERARSLLFDHFDTAPAAVLAATQPMYQALKRAAEESEERHQQQVKVHRAEGARKAAVTKRRNKAAGAALEWLCRRQVALTVFGEGEARPPTGEHWRLAPWPPEAPTPTRAPRFLRLLKATSHEGLNFDTHKNRQYVYTCHHQGHWYHVGAWRAAACLAALREKFTFLDDISLIVVRYAEEV